MRLTQWAKQEGVHPKTAYRWYREGILAVPARKIGARTILVDIPVEPYSGSGSTALYAQVGSQIRKKI